MSTVIVLLIVGAICFAIIRDMYKKKKQGRSSCSCGCSGCLMAGSCSAKKDK